MDYRRFTLKVGEPGDWNAVKQGLAAFDGWIMVNVSADQCDPGVLFLPETVQELLEIGLLALHLEGVDKREYYALLLEQIERFLETGADLRQRLCRWRVRQMQPDLQNYLDQLRNFLQFVVCHDCQQESFLPQPVFAALRYAAEQLAVSAFCHEDNVRCMDHLGYELAPCLMELRKNIKNRCEENQTLTPM